MKKNLFIRELTEFNWDISSREELLERFTDSAESKGYVKPSYRAAIAERETKFPTALPTQPEAIAIPHADAEHIIKPFIAPIRLRTPVPWLDMGDRETVHDVRFIFALGFNNTDGHVQVLQLLVNNFQNPEFTQALNDASDADSFFEAVISMDGLAE